MTAIGADTFDILYDLFLALGFSAAVWFCYHVMTLIVPKKHLWLTVPLHILFFALAGFLSFCFIVGETTSRQPRWHMALGFAMGAWIYFSWFARYTRFGKKFLIRFAKLLVGPLARLADLLCRIIIKPMGTYLQKQRRLQYNRRMERRAKQTARDRKNDQTEKPKKEPIRPYFES